jgi:hypothetical protein
MCAPSSSACGTALMCVRWSQRSQRVLGWSASIAVRSEASGGQPTRTRSSMTHWTDDRKQDVLCQDYRRSRLRNWLLSQATGELRRVDKLRECVVAEHAEEDLALGWLEKV